jgi:hypothetical protein
MAPMVSIFQFRKQTAWLVKVVAASMLLAVCSRAVAQPGVGNVSLNLRLSADADLIQNPDDPALAMLAAWKTQYDLQLARNMPYLLITNTSQMESIEATGMTMTLGQPDFHFGSVQTIDASPGVDVTVKLGNGDDVGMDADQFELVFTGLMPGAFALLQLDIDPDDASAFHLPDFRTVLFQANGAGTDVNSVVDAALADTVSGVPVGLNGMFEDYPIDGPFFVGPAFHGYGRMDEVNVFAMDLSGSLGIINPVPEPSALALLAMGALAMMGVIGFRHFARPGRTGTDSPIMPKKSKGPVLL